MEARHSSRQKGPVGNRPLKCAYAAEHHGQTLFLLVLWLVLF
jgi:hypothetical protein